MSTEKYISIPNAEQIASVLYFTIGVSMKKLLLAVGIMLVSVSCSREPEQQILGKWESSGVFIAEFTPQTASWAGGGCKHSGYKIEIKQANGEQFKVISFTCKESIPDGKPADITLSAALIDADTMVFISQTYFRVK